MAHLGSFSNHQNLLVLIEPNSSYLTSSLSNEKVLSWLFLLFLIIKNQIFLWGWHCSTSQMTTFFFKFLKDESLDYLVVIIEELTTCVAIEMQHW
jgi:hypothetical protein